MERKKNKEAKEKKIKKFSRHLNLDTILLIDTQNYPTQGKNAKLVIKVLS